MSYATEREEHAAKASEWMRRASLGELADALQAVAYDMVRRGDTPEAANHLYEASLSLRAADRAKEGAETRRTYCMFCRGVTMGEPPAADCKYPSGHLDEGMRPYVAPPPLNHVGAAITFADRYAGAPWYAGCDYNRERDGQSLVVSHWAGTEPPEELMAFWAGFSLEYKAVERRGF